MALKEDQLLYVMCNEFDLYKIGISVDPENRAKIISNNSGVEVEVVKVFDTGSLDALDVEQYLHRVLQAYRKKGEWFSTELDVILKEVEDVLSNPNKVLYFCLDLNTVVSEVSTNAGETTTVKVDKSKYYFEDFYKSSVYSKLDCEAFETVFTQYIFDNASASDGKWLDDFILRVWKTFMKDRLKEVLLVHKGLFSKQDCTPEHYITTNLPRDGLVKDDILKALSKIKRITL